MLSSKCINLSLCGGTSGGTGGDFIFVLCNNCFLNCKSVMATLIIVIKLIELSL